MPLIPKQQPPYYEPTSSNTIIEYSALLNQISTNDPTAKLLKTINGTTITYSYDSVGNYVIIASNNIFTENKTQIIFGGGNTGGSPTICSWFWMAENFIGIQSYDIFAQAFADGILIDHSIKIFIYP